MKKILLLGEGGFVGKNLLEFLGRYEYLYEICVPTIDISDEHAVKKQLEKQYYDVIIHAAVYNPRADFIEDSSKELDKNLRMFFNFERHQNLYGKMLYFGSGAEFDKREGICMIDEDETGNGIPATDYGLYKYIINKSIQQSENIHNLRIFGLFGNYENWKKTFISGACCKALKDLPITIRQNVYLDYLYIDDFCKIIKRVIDSAFEHRVYNVVSGKRKDLLTIAKIVKEVSGKRLPIYVCKDGLANEYSASNQRLLNEYGEFIFTSIEDAIRDLYIWYKNHEGDIDLYPLLYQKSEKGKKA